MTRSLAPKPFVQQKRQLSQGMRGIYGVQAAASSGCRCLAGGQPGYRTGCNRGRTRLVLTGMKVSDDYNAKYRMWVANPIVAPAGKALRLPDFKSRRFASHAELNAWKLSVLLQLARALPAR
jgi:hypothetical protein